MNGIIHPCFHPDVLMMLNQLHLRKCSPVCLSTLIGSSTLFFSYAVTPIAKFSRIKGGRYCCVLDIEISEEKEDKLRRQFAMEGKKLLPKAEKTQVDDPNNIAPGTEFMYELSKALQGYIQTRLKENPAWKNLKVILSDANVPGEGEHKIVVYVQPAESAWL